MSFPSEKFTQCVTDQIIKNLREVGFAVIDNIFDEEWTTSMRDEIKTLYQLNQLYSNKTYYQGRMEGGKFTYSYSVMKPNVHELDLLKPETRENTPYLDAMFHDKSMINHFNSKIPGLNLDCLDIKVQYNSGNGGCFPMHFDTTQEVSKRQITGTLYLNPNWKKGDGGELRVYPFPYYQLDVEPINNRLVLFSSHQTLHRVLPANKERYVITLWFSGTPSEPQYPTFSWLKNVEGIGFILNPMNRKSLSKVIYEEDWAQSIQESFNVGEDMDKVLETHRKDVEAIKTKLGDSVLEFIGECLPLGHDEHFKEHLSKLD